MKNVLLLGLIACLGLFSCGKEQVNNSESLVGHELKSGVGRVVCLEFVYPITYIMPDRSTITRDSEEKMNVAIKRWYGAHPRVTVRPVLQFPVNVKFRGKPLTINNEQQMLRVKDACK